MAEGNRPQEHGRRTSQIDVHYQLTSDRDM